MVINVAEFILQLFIVHIYAFFFVNFRNIDRKDCFLEKYRVFAWKYL